MEACITLPTPREAAAFFDMDWFCRYQQSVRWLEQFDSSGRTMQFMHDRSNPERYLQRTRLLLRLLGNPDKTLKFVHITGTAGKGTVSTMVHDGLANAGKRVGLFTSPYCVTVAENIQVNGRLISAAEFSDLVERVRPVVERMYLFQLRSRFRHFGLTRIRRNRDLSDSGRAGMTGLEMEGPSYFEILLAIAFVYFQQQKCELAVLEVGLGGRYDATNVIDPPIVSAITNIGWDHTKILGPTLRHIARDKAGIIKQGSVFFAIEHRKELLTLFHAVCRRVGARFHALSHRRGARENNRQLAIAILKHLGVPHPIINSAIEKARLPCRFEIMERHPFVILDGAHNEMKIRSLIEQLQSIVYRRLVVVLGILSDKDTQSIARALSRVADAVILTRGSMNPHWGRSWTSFALLTKAFRVHRHLIIKQEKSPVRALGIARSRTARSDAILVTGSFYLAGELRTQWHSERSILRRRSNF